MKKIVFFFIPVLLVASLAVGENYTAGLRAGNALTTGNYNIIIGQWAAGRQKTGSYNIIMGYMADYADSSNSSRFVVQNYPSTPLLFGDLANGRLTVNGTSASTYTFDIQGTLGVLTSVNTPSLSNASGAVTVDDSLTVSKDLVITGRAYTDTLSNPAGVLTIADSLAITGVLNTLFSVNLSDANDVLTAAESGQFNIYRPISGKRTATLPEASVGLLFGFMVADSDTLRVTVASGDSLIASDGSASVYQTSVAGSFWALAIDAVRWIMLSPVGTWTAY